MKKYLFLAATAFMFAACSNEEATVPQVAETNPNAGAVAFDTYIASATRAGDPGIQTTATLQVAGKGFGVFAQHSGTYAIGGTTPVTNFMWNEHVTYGAASAWTYSPLKYWPNETGTDSQDPKATSTDVEKLSFFAYAPYVAEHPSAGGKGYILHNGSVSHTADPEISDSHLSAEEAGITSIVSNSQTTYDPWVRYTVASKPSESVDLLWGVAPSGGLEYKNVTGSNTTVGEGLPLKNLLKPSKDQKIKFLFKHALARLGMTVVYAKDQIAAGGSIDATETKIAVKSVTVTESTTTKYLKTKGALNLNNTTKNKSLWSNLSDDVVSFTVSNAVDGELNPNIAYKTDANTTFTQPDPWTGVKNVELPVIADGKYFMVIPGNTTSNDGTSVDVKLDVTITYAVITADSKLSGGYSEVENIITKTVTIPGFTNNKAYNLKLILGMTSVKLDAEVADWEVDGSTEVYLPQNTAE